MEPLAGARGHAIPALDWAARTASPQWSPSPERGVTPEKPVDARSTEWPQWGPSPERGVTPLVLRRHVSPHPAAMEPLAGARGHGGARVGLPRKGFGSLPRDLP